MPMRSRAGDGSEDGGGSDDGDRSMHDSTRRIAGETDPLDGWIDRPELRPLLRRLVAGGHPEALAAAETEVAVARRLLDHGAEIRVEIETPDGRHCDFEVKSDGHVAYLHVKRLRGISSGRSLRLSPQLRKLESIERGYVVSIWWSEDLGRAGIRKLVDRAGRFIMEAKVGDEMVHRGDDDGELGGCRVLAPSTKKRVTLVYGLPQGFHERAPRVQRLLRKAYRQFMPGAVNVILICGTDDPDELAVETALLGSHVERWDRFPPEGRRIAHGRSDDGFWHGQRCVDSRIAGWFRLADDGAMEHSRLWFRDEATARDGVGVMLRRVLDAR